ncbi:MAG: FAD-dependent oxidoreductase [Gammaproteobacteria bacterium]|nr:FAD-dependent oxidoreductase [Gammaproteobacteria bacterium]NIR81637.1 FAD-dependent oxidoreductase [Gammaproteobacteria bacterium]NIR88188.1 FAD-dependent oxidoreductase [Gammaproteobacteria bacterium]NIU02749.1 FAD-dependent oxidoreductase [Gammaproteobacteria bacterium]NIV73348.1 FAD-dependent oxidoreductase [Gammaproteobacteria bacterium]
MDDGIVIIGAGHCAGQLAARLRAEGYEGRVRLIGEEPHVPYQRPPLSKAYLAGHIGLERVHMRPRKFYESQSIELMLESRVTRLDPGRRSLTLASGEAVDYEKLVLATGSRPRRLPVPGTDLEGICYLRRVEDADALREAFRPGLRLVIVGGGYIGLEVASVARGKGAEVSVLETERRLMSRVVGAQVSEFYRRVHGEAGVDVRTGMRVSGFEGDGGVARVVCDDGSRIDADLVLVAIGILPDTGLGGEAGLEIDDGMVVDEFGRTSDPHIYAAGDCTNHPNPIYGRRVRLESVHNAMAQGRVVAANLAGKAMAYGEVPWFWSDQYDVKLQIAGLSQGYDDAFVRGDFEGGRFTLFYLKNGVLIAADTVNEPQDHLACRKLVGKREAFSREQLADPDVALKDLAAGA